jgi:lipoyl(octanoyl) transferase
MAATTGAFGVPAARRDGLPGLWVDPEGPLPRKIGALGVRVERGVTYHGIALNVTTDLRDFGLIDPCGMPGIGVTSIGREAGWSGERAAPSTESVAEAAAIFSQALASALDADLIWSRRLPTAALATAS